jgi:hypothetical protein
METTFSTVSNNNVTPTTKWELQKAKYSVQKDLWPTFGKHILAQYGEDWIVVYQAYNKDIADYAVENQKFGGSHWSSTRMTWIKTNFLWMMFRSDWALKKNQDHILAIWLKLSSFEKYLSMGLEAKESEEKGTVRLQWDPDHDPDGEPHLARKAVQLGIRNIDTFISGADILQIQDITEFVHEQYQAIKKKDWTILITPEEKVYKSKAFVQGELKPLRIMLCYKGKTKAVILQERSVGELVDLVHRKFKGKAKEFTVSTTGKTITNVTLVDLPHDTLINVL